MIPEVFLARRYIFRAKARHISFAGIVSCIGIALGVATLIIVISVMNGFDHDLTEKLLKFNYHLTVEVNQNQDLYKIKEVVEDWEEVNSASIFLQTQVFAKFDELILPLMVRGIDFSNQAEKNNFYQYVTKDTKKAGFFISENLKRRFFIQDKLEVYPLDKNLNLETKNIRGLFEIGVYDIDNNYIITDLENAKSLSKNYLLFLGVKTTDPFGASQLEAKILDQFGEDVFTSTWMESNQALFSALKLEKVTMFIILSLIVLVAAFNIFVTLTSAVVDKTKDIGILKSLGFSSKKILTIFSLQGLILGVIGTFSGVFMGLGVCLALKKYNFIKLPQEIYFVDNLPVAINYLDIALIAFMGVFLSYLFSLFPAAKAAKLQPAEALRYE